MSGMREHERVVAANDADAAVAYVNSAQVRSQLLDPFSSRNIKRILADVIVQSSRLGHANTVMGLTPSDDRHGRVQNIALKGAWQEAAQQLVGMPIDDVVTQVAVGRGLEKIGARKNAHAQAYMASAQDVLASERGDLVESRDMVGSSLSTPFANRMKDDVTPVSAGFGNAGQLGQRRLSFLEQQAADSEKRSGGPDAASAA